jgi:hypothetical protein
VFPKDRNGKTVGKFMKDAYYRSEYPMERHVGDRRDQETDDDHDHQLFETSGLEELEKKDKNPKYERAE